MKQQLNGMQRAFVRMTGHSSQTTAANGLEDYGGLTKLGAAVGVAALVAGTNGALAAWEFGDALAPTLRVGVAAAGALVGATLVLVVDRAAVYFSDTVRHTSRGAAFCYLGMRVATILAMSTLASQATLPLLLKGELRGHAQAMVDAKEHERMSALNTQFDTEGLARQQAKHAVQVERLQGELEQLPASITRQLSAAQGCWIARTQQSQALVASGVPTGERESRLAARAQQCRTQSQRAEAERGRHVARTQRALDMARADETASSAALAETTATIRQRVDTVRKIELEAYTPRSADVLASLIASNPGARAKWLLLTVLQLALELLPLVLKFNAGRSPLGERIATERETRALARRRRLAEQEHLGKMSEYRHALELGVARDIVNSSVAREAVAERHLEHIRRTAGMQSAGEMIDQMKRRWDQIDELAEQRPSERSAAIDIWNEGLSAGGPLRDPDEPGARKPVEKDATLH